MKCVRLAGGRGQGTPDQVPHDWRQSGSCTCHLALYQLHARCHASCNWCVIRACQTKFASLERLNQSCFDCSAAHTLSHTHRRASTAVPKTLRGCRQPTECSSASTARGSIAPWVCNSYIRIYTYICVCMCIYMYIYLQSLNFEYCQKRVKQQPQ